AYAFESHHSSSLNRSALGVAGGAAHRSIGFDHDNHARAADLRFSPRAALLGRVLGVAVAARRLVVGRVSLRPRFGDRERFKFAIAKLSGSCRNRVANTSPFAYSERKRLRSDMQLIQP